MPAWLPDTSLNDQASTLHHRVQRALSSGVCRLSCVCAVLDFIVYYVLYTYNLIGNSPFRFDSCVGVVQPATPLAFFG